MKILHLPTSTGGNSWGLSQAERKLGHNSQVLIADRNPFQYQADIKITTSFGEKTRFPLISDITSGYNLFKAFIKVRNLYDVFHFNFGKSLLDFPSLGLNLLDIPYYPKKSKIIVTYNGCDARQKRGTMKRTKVSACHQKMCYGGVCTNQTDQQKIKNIQKFSHYSSHIFALNPDLLHFLPNEKASFLPYTIHGWDSVSNHQLTFPKDDKIVIVHAPSQPVAKGTPYLLQSIDRLQKEYPNKFDFILIQNLPHQKALEIYLKADLIIDQLLVGWYGAFAVEAMAMGKPVAAYIREEDLFFIPDKMRDDLLESIINVSIHSIYENLRYIIENPKVLNFYAKKCQKYAETWHNPITIAKTALSYY